MGKPDKFNVIVIGLLGTRWLGNRVLHTVMEEKGFNMHTVFLRETYQIGSPVEDEECRHILDLIRELKPGLVGLTLTSFYVDVAKRLSALIKDEFETKIVWGGVHPSIDPEGSLKYADMVCIGEGEDSLPELAGSLRDKDGKTDIEGVWFKNNGEIIKNKNRPLIDDLDTVPFPDFSDKNKYYIINSVLHREENPSPLYKYEYNIMSCRGCPFSCSYCVNHLKSSIQPGKKLRRRSVANVIDELKKAKTDFPKLNKINFWDDVFVFDKEWLSEFGALYRKEIGIPFFCYVHPKYVDDDRIRILKQMGVEDIGMGLQHGSKRIRNGYFERKESDESIIKAANIIVSNQIHLHMDVITTPFDNEDDNYENIEFLLKLPKPFLFYMHSLTFFPNYKITERALLEKVISQEQIVGDGCQKEIATSKEEILKNPWLGFQHLMGKRYIPNGVIDYMVKTKFHFNHTKGLKLFISLCLRFEEILGAYRRSVVHVKNGEFGHIFTMFGFLLKSIVRQKHS